MKTADNAEMRPENKCNYFTVIMVASAELGFVKVGNGGVSKIRTLALGTNLLNDSIEKKGLYL